MPYYRRTYRRRTFRPRRMTRKRVYRRKYSRFGKRKMNSNVYYFKRKVNTLYDWALPTTVTNIIAPAPGQPYIGNFAFRLSEVPGYTDFTNMYDSYRIRAVKLNFLPVNNTSSWVGLTGGTGGTIPFTTGQYAIRSFSAYDPNRDGVGITGSDAVSQIQEYQNCKWSPYNRIHKRYIKPKIQLDSGGGVSGFVNMPGKQPWLQCANVSVEHYGMPFVIEPTAIPQGTLLYKIEATFYMQFLRPK